MGGRALAGTGTALVLALASMLVLACPARAQIGPEPPASTIEAQALAAESAKQWDKAYSLCLRAASDYISEHNQAKSDEMNAACERIKREWHDATSSPSSAGSTSSTSSGHPLWSAFTPRDGRPNGRYNCSTMLMRLVGMSSPGGVGGMPLRVPQMMFLGALKVTPGHYSGRTTTPGTWSGSGENLRFSGAPFNIAKAEFGVNGSGRSTIRFTWPPKIEGATPQVWMCTR